MSTAVKAYPVSSDSTSTTVRAYPASFPTPSTPSAPASNSNSARDGYINDSITSEDGLAGTAITNTSLATTNAEEESHGRSRRRGPVRRVLQLGTEHIRERRSPREHEGHRGIIRGALYHIRGEESERIRPVHHVLQTIRSVLPVHRRRDHGARREARTRPEANRQIQESELATAIEYESYDSK